METNDFRAATQPIHLNMKFFTIDYVGEVTCCANNCVRIGWLGAAPQIQVKDYLKNFSYYTLLHLIIHFLALPFFCKPLQT
jgi:hypothetical protein